MTRLKNKDGCCLLFFSVWLIFHKNNKSVSAKIMTGLSLSILSTEKSQSIQLPTYSSCGAHIRSGDNNFFSCSGRRVFYSIATGRTTEIAEVSRRQPMDVWKTGPEVLTNGKLRRENADAESGIDSRLH